MARPRKSQQVFIEMTDAQYGALHDLCCGLLEHGPGKWMLTGSGCNVTTARKLEEMGCAKVKEIEGSNRLYVKPTTFAFKVQMEQAYAE